jgi:two-component system chemotaxis sensor kinase CheA
VLNEALDELREISRLHSESAWRAKRQTLRIYRDLSAMRVIPADSVFGGVRKMVRDLARRDGKEVEIDVEGLGLKVDRLILQALKDPVMHLLRNAIAHGIETPEARRARGKPPIGQIAFRISTERNLLTIRIEDDGKGLDRQRILEEARRRGVLGKTALLPESVEAVTALLLRPGFSTEHEVSELAGRGMGLSVVDKAIGPLQGRFVLSPREPAGTAAIITVPLSVASSQFLLVRAEQLYAIPFHCIERIERVSLEDIIWTEGRPAYIGRARREMIPLARLADLIGESGIGPLDGDLQIVLVKSGPGLFGLVVESLAGLQDALIHDLNGALPGLDWIAGGLVLPDSSVCPVVNPAALEVQAAGVIASWPARAAPRSEERQAEILVVDDSITTRTLEKSILEARGFRVSLSIDGMDALEMLRRHPVDLVIADVEMPRMDGFELVHAIKTDPALAGIPVVLVTSRNDEKDQRKGLALGADAYLVKQRFDARKLLDTVDQIL